MSAKIFFPKDGRSGLLTLEIVLVINIIVCDCGMSLTNAKYRSFQGIAAGRAAGGGNRATRCE